MLVCQIMTTAYDTVPKARLCHKEITTMKDPEIRKEHIEEGPEKQEELAQEDLKKVSGGVPLLHSVRHYEDPPEEPKEGGYEGTW